MPSVNASWLTRLAQPVLAKVGLSNVQVPKVTGVKRSHSCAVSDDQKEVSTEPTIWADLSRRID